LGVELNTPEQLAHSRAPIGNLNLLDMGISREDWMQRYASRIADEDFRSPYLAVGAWATGERFVREATSPRPASGR
jgi:hypothetical protein